MSRRRSTAPPERASGAPADYQCARVDEVWHATQEQASPPPIHQGGAWTICAIWATFVRGYERRRPTCPVCLHACEIDEGVAQPRLVPVAGRPGTFIQSDGTTVHVADVILPARQRARVEPPQSVRDGRAAEEASFDARLEALVAVTRGTR